jgi:hypothetical protein
MLTDSLPITIDFHVCDSPFSINVHRATHPLSICRRHHRHHISSSQEEDSKMKMDREPYNFEHSVKQLFEGSVRQPNWDCELRSLRARLDCWRDFNCERAIADCATFATAVGAGAAQWRLNRMRISNHGRRCHQRIEARESIMEARSELDMRIRMGDQPSPLANSSDQQTTAQTRRHQRKGALAISPDEVAWRRNLAPGSNQCLAIVLEIWVLVECCGILSERPCSIQEPPERQTVTSIEIRGRIVASHESNAAEGIGSWANARESRRSPVKAPLITPNVVLKTALINAPPITMRWIVPQRFF